MSKKAKAKAAVMEKLLVKVVAEKGTRRLFTDEEWEEQQRRVIAEQTGEADKQNHVVIAQQSQVGEVKVSRRSARARPRSLSTWHAGDVHRALWKCVFD